MIAPDTGMGGGNSARSAAERDHVRMVCLGSCHRLPLKNQHKEKRKSEAFQYLVAYKNTLLTFLEEARWTHMSINIETSCWPVSPSR